MAEKTKVRATIEPGVVREVDDAELVDLQRQGLIHSFEHTDHALEVLPADFKAPHRWREPDKGEDVVTPPPGITDPAASAATETGAKSAKKGE